MNAIRTELTVEEGNNLETISIF